jgi:riboflavin synthase
MEGTNLVLTFESNISSELKVDQSLAHQGVCLTVVACDDHGHRVVAVQETLDRSTLGNLKVGDRVNLERCLRVGDRLDGHWVQGHVDATGLCIRKESRDGSWTFAFSFPAEHQPLLVPKGSVTVNGVSLTVVEVGEGTFSVAVIPYTFEHTTLGELEEGQGVNLEFDILGKYFLQHIKSRS